jgi:hypothetical protein
MKTTPDFSEAFLKKLPSAFSELLIEIDSKLTPQTDRISFPDPFSERLPDIRKHPKPEIVSSAQSESQKKLFPENC